MSAPLVNNIETENQPLLDFDSLLISYSSVQVLGLLAALQLHPKNHGRNARMERLCRKALLNFDPNDSKARASWEHLKEVIGNYTAGSHEEDPLTNAITEVAIFEQGNYLVYSGLYVGFTEILNQLTECIFLVKNNLNQDFVKNVRDAIGLLLFMSNSVAYDAGHTAYMYQKGNTGNIEFPSYDKTVEYVDAVYFTRTFLLEVCERCRYDISVLNEFILHPIAEELRDDDPENNVVNFKPIVELGDSLLLYMPTGVLNALVSYIYRKAKEYGCYETLLDLLYARQFHLSCVALGNTGWMATDIKLPALKNSLAIRETVFQFDNQKLGYVCYLQPGIVTSAKPFTGHAQGIQDPYRERTNEVVGYLSKLNPEQTFGVFCLYIIGEAGQDFLFAWAKPSAGNQSLALTYKELWTITHSSAVNNMTLWKFAKCYSRTGELTTIMSMGGTLDAFAIYKQNHGSLMDSDEANPLGGILMIVPGSSDDFARQVQKEQNEHAVTIFYERKPAFAKVTRFKEYAPIYLEREISEGFRIVIESYDMPIWITNPQTKGRKSGWGTYVCEAIAFWLNKMANLLSGILNKQHFIQFEIEVIVADELLSPVQYNLQPVSLEKILIQTRTVAPTIQVIIPFNYICAVILPDNTADRMLMKAVLNGLVEYIKTAGNSTEITEAVIDEIIDKTLQPPTAKMLLFSDTSVNVKMDDRNLPSLRYLHATDISYILDNLVSYLPKGYKIPKDIPDKKDKMKLCDDIVTAIIVQITDRLVSFDGKEFLKWLIKLNEKCIQIKEFREILIPAKIACFSDFDTEVQQLLDGEKNLITTAHATRTLIEFVATKIPTGNKWPNFDDTDELLALTNQLTEWGALRDAIHLGIDDPKIGLLPSGRIGTDKTVEREAFKPYAVAKTESALFRDMEDFESNYVQSRKTGKAVETEESKALDNAFEAEFGITLTSLSTMIGSLVNEGVARGKACVQLKETQVKDLLCAIEGITQGMVNTALALLTLLERDGIGMPPFGYTYIDIFPWRYNRSVSYLRRPLVKLHKECEVYYYYGYRHLMQYIDDLFYLLLSSKLPGAVSTEMQSWLASVSGKKGHPFRADVKAWFETNSNYEVIPYEVKMDKSVSANHIKTDKAMGDIDLLVVDHNNLIIYPIECKNIHGGRNVHEMKVEMDDYLGRNGNDKKAKMRKHFERHQWLGINKSALTNLIPNAEKYTIRSLILTADEIPLGYLKKDNLPLPVKSFTFLRKKGLSYLSEK